MARYEHLPIWNDAMQLAVRLERVWRAFRAITSTRWVPSYGVAKFFEQRQAAVCWPSQRIMTTAIVMNAINAVRCIHSTSTGNNDMSLMTFGYRCSKTVLVLLALGLAAMGVQAQTCPAGNPRVAPDERYVNNGDGTVTDNETGLMWSRCSEGQSGAACASGTVSIMSWSSALTAANASTLAGHDDWRLPNIMELQSLVETGCYDPSINTTMFPATASTYYWSSTTYARYASYAWVVSRYYGFLSANLKSNNNAVRLVRGGQGLDTFAAENGPIFKDGFEDVNAQPVPRHGDSTLVTRSPD